MKVYGDSDCAKFVVFRSNLKYERTHCLTMLVTSETSTFSSFGATGCFSSAFGGGGSAGFRFRPLQPRPGRAQGAKRPRGPALPNVVTETRGLHRITDFAILL